MTLLGANGMTEQELKDVLNLNLKNNELLDITSNYFDILKTLNNNDTSLIIANKIYANNNFKLVVPYTNNIANCFDGEIQSLDFSKPNESAKTMNNWISNKTNNRIQNMIDPRNIDALTRMFLINTIYFKSIWKFQFDKSKTVPMAFILNDLTPVNAQMMILTKTTLNTQINPAGLDIMTCQLPYSGSISMTILLPYLNSSIGELEKSLTSTNLKTILTEANDVPTNVYLPKFKIQFKSEVFSKIFFKYCFN